MRLSLFVSPDASVSSCRFPLGRHGRWGIASLPGAIFGGIFVEVIEKYADAVARALSSSLHLPIDVEPWTIYGLALILLVFVMPTGIAGGLATLVGYFRRRLTANAQGK